MRKYFSYVLIHPRWIRQNRRQNTRRPHNCTEGTLLVIAQSTASNVATCINNFFPTLKTLNLAHFAHLLSITHHIDQKYFFKNEKTFIIFPSFYIIIYIFFLSNYYHLIARCRYCFTSMFLSLALQSSSTGNNLNEFCCNGSLTCTIVLKLHLIN